MKIYIDNKKLISDFWNIHSTFIDMEKDKWVFTEDINDSVIVPILIGSDSTDEFLKKTITDQHILLILDIFDINEGMLVDQNLNRYLEITDKVVYLHKNYKLKDDARYVYFDCMWDRQKLFCTEYDKIDHPSSCSWTRESLPEVYQLGPIDKQPIKKFLSPQRIYPGNSPKQHIRRMLQTFLKEYSDYGYISYVGTGGEFLKTNNDTNISTYVSDPTGGVWYPAADSYYNSSYISIYTETLVCGYNAQCITEKTFDPLIKGNFILPFGYQGIISHLVDYYGFKIPSWINYSYENIENTYDRFGCYLNQLVHLLNYSVDDLHDLYLENKHILDHNRSVFYTRSYCGIYDNVYTFVKSKDWC